MKAVIESVIVFINSMIGLIKPALEPRALSEFLYNE